MPGDTESQSEPYEERQSEEFSVQHWEHALAGVFARAAIDEGFRLLCLTDPRAAVHAVEPDLRLPGDFKFFFCNEGKDLIHSYLLPSPLPPPPLFKEQHLRRFAKETIESYVNNGANVTCTGTPNSTGVNCGQRGKGGGSPS